jgi:hypothetical protein
MPPELQAVPLTVSLWQSAVARLADEVALDSAQQCEGLLSKPVQILTVADRVRVKSGRPLSAQRQGDTVHYRVPGQVLEFKDPLGRALEQLLAAVDEAKEFEKKGRGERKATGTNVAAAIFFWPGLIATYSNTEDAINAAKERQNYLMKLYSEKKCSDKTASVSVSNQLEQRLEELKAMYEKKLLSEDEYKSARKKALGL